MAYTSPFDIQDDDPEFQAFKKQFLGGGDQPNAPGFVTGIKQGLGGFTSGIGQVAEDLGWKNNPIKSYGDEVQANNPSSAASQSWEGFKESPWQGIKEFAGQGIGSTLPSLAAFALPGGQGAAATGLARVGMVARGLPMQTALAAAPIYGQVREDQQHQGFDDIPSAAAAAIGGGIVESKLGIQRVLGKNTEAPLKSFVNELASSPLKTGLKTWGRTGLEEGAEEILQQPMQQLGAHRNPLTEESLRDTAWSGFGGLIGGLAMGGLGGAKMGLAHKRIDDFRQQDLLNPNTPLNVLDDQAKWNQAFIERDQGVPAGEHFYNQRQGEIDQYIEGLVPQMQEQQRLENAHRIFDVLNTNGGFTAEGQGADILNETFGIGQKPVKQQYARAYNAPLETPVVVSDNSGNPITLSTVGEAYDYRHGVGKFAPQAAKVDALGYPLSPYQPVEATQPSSTTPSWSRFGVEPTQGDSNVQPTQVAQGSNQAASGNSSGSAGNTPNQPGVGRGGDNAAGAPVGRSGANQPVGNTSGGVGAVNPATAGFGTKQKALWNDAIAKLGEGHQALESINQTITSGKLAQAAKEIEQAAQPKDARTLAEKLLASLPKGRKGKVAKEGIDYAGVLSTFVGFDGNNDEKLEAVAKAHGYNDRQRAHQIIYGYTTPKGKYIPGAVERLKDLALKNGYTAEEARQAISDLGFARNDQYGLSDDQKEIASLTGALETGIESPNQGKLDFADAAQQGMLSRELHANPVTDSAGESENLGGSAAMSEAERLAAEQELDKATTEEVANSEKIKGTVEERGLTVDEIRAKRAAEAQAKADAKDSNLEEAKVREATMAPKYNFTPEQYAKAEEFWDELLVEDDIKFSELSQESKDRYTQLVVEQLSHPSGHVDFNKLEAQQGLLKYEEQVDGKQSKTQRFAAGTTGQVESSEAGTDRGTQSAETEEVSQPSRSESASEEVTAEGVVSRWNQGAKALGVTTWDGLSSEQQSYILGSGTWEEFDEAAGEVLDEINDDQGAAKFSESNTDKGVDPQKLSTTLRKLFFSPEKFNKLVSIYPDAASIPLDVKEAAAADAHMSVKDVPWEHVQGFAMNGKVYLVAGNIKEGNELGVFLHELGVHVGMEKLIGKANMQRLSSQIEQWAAKNDGSQESKLAKDAVRRAEGSASEDRQQEVIAYFVEEAVKAGVNPVAVQKTNSPLAKWFRSLWAAAKLALRKIGFDRFDQLTAQNIVDLSYGAAKMELTGTWHGTAADFRNFNHSYMGSGEGAQAFGWGTYLAQRVGIAKGYWKDDVKRKKNGGSHYDQVFIDGAPIHRSLGFDNDAFYFEADMLNGDETPAQLKQAVLTQLDQQIRQTEWAINNTVEPENIDEEERKWRAEYQTRRKEELDGLKAAKVTIRMMHSDRFGYPPENNVEGSLMRVDTAVHDDEMLDWDKPLSEQSEVVKEALGSVGISQRGEWNPTGENLYRSLQNDEDRLEDAGFDATDKGASEYLDSIGIKGIKFLDSQSRGLDGVPKVRSKQRSDGTFTHYVDYRDKQGFAASKAFTDKAEAINFAKQLEQNLTRNLVIFNDKNIQRVATQVGADRNRVKFSQAEVKAHAERISGETGKQLIDDTSSFLKKIGRSMEFLNDLVDRAKKVLPSAGEWYNAFQKMQAAKNQMERKAEEVAAMADTLKAERYKMVNSFLGDSTFEQKWGFQPSWKKEKVTIDSKMAGRWAQLSKEEKSLIEAVFKHGDEFITQRDAIFKKLGIDDKLISSSRLQGPYAPLKRFGNYVAVLKSKELIAAENAAKLAPNAANKKRVDELKKNPDHFVSKQFDTIGQARRFSRANANDWAFTDAFEGSTNVDDRTTMDYQVLQKVMGSLNATNLPAYVRTEMENTIRDIYVSSVDEHSARMSGLKRKNRAGYDEDMIRSFLSNARANASFLANLEHGTEMNNAFYAMQNETKDADGRRGGQDLFNSIAEHYKLNLHYEDTPVQDRAVALTSAWQLSTSLGYHLANATQGIQVSIPWLAGQFNDYRGAWRHMMAGYSTLGQIVKGTGGYNGVDLSKVKNPKLREALEHAYNMNLLDVGIQEDLSHFDRFRTGYATLDATSGTFSKVMHKLRRVASMVETWNRVSSATAAYNMAIEKGKSHEQALIYVEGVLRKTQGDFTRADAPLLLKKLPKPTVQYRKYQFMMGAFYTSAFLKAFYGATAEEKAIGKRVLGFKLFHTSMAAGVLGMPLMNLAALVFSAIGGDDEPKDLEASLREAIGNKSISDLILHGPLAALGFDMSSKLGDDKVFSVAPYTDFDFTSAKGATTTLSGIAGGPALSQVGRMASGVGFIKDGELYKGVERLMPKGFESAMQSYRLANEGFTLKNGDVMVKPEDISAFGLTLNAFGLPSTEVKSMQWLSRHQQEIGQFYTDHTKALQHEYLAAYKEHDTEKMAELRQDWLDLQKGKEDMRHWFNGRPDELKRQPLSNLLTYPQTVAKRERKHQRAFDSDSL